MQTLPLQEGRKQDLIAFSLYFQKIMLQKIPPGGGGFALLAISLNRFITGSKIWFKHYSSLKFPNQVLKTTSSVYKAKLSKFY